MRDLKFDQSIYTFLNNRRSASILSEPKPNHEELIKILNVGGTVPDHGALKPYRFIVIQNGAREAFGEGLVNAAEEAKSAQLENEIRLKITAKAFAAPMQILIVFCPIDHPKIPEWEQMAAASCTGFALSLAANSIGFGAVWKNFAYAPGSSLRRLLQLQEHEILLGWINIGTEQERLRQPREDLNLSRHVTFLNSHLR